MGDVVYDSGEKIREGTHVYVHSRKDGKEGVAQAAGKVELAPGTCTFFVF